jgi:hypothetical protein
MMQAEQHWGERLGRVIQISSSSCLKLEKLTQTVGMKTAVHRCSTLQRKEMLMW